MLRRIHSFVGESPHISQCFQVSQVSLEASAGDAGPVLLRGFCRGGGAGWQVQYGAVATRSWRFPSIGVAPNHPILVVFSIISNHLCGGTHIYGTMEPPPT